MPGGFGVVSIPPTRQLSKDTKETPKRPQSAKKRQVIPNSDLENRDEVYVQEEDLDQDIHPPFTSNAKKHMSF